MDYLDPKKQLQHRITLFTGYVFVTIAIVIATILLLYQAYGFGLGKHGQVVQNDVVFVSSHPNPANIYIDNKLNSASTNTRLYLPGGVYNVTLKRDGYLDWNRKIVLNGGDVEHYDYPFLFPKTLSSSKLKDYTALPGLITQSNDRRWLLVQQPGSMTNFDEYDIKAPTKAPVLLTIPSSILSKATSTESWKLEEWADDNQHVILEHLYDGKTEYILVDRSDPAQSINLNTTLSTTPTMLTLNNKKYDEYYLYNSADSVLKTASIKDPSPTSLIDHVLAYHSYGDDTVLYITNTDASTGKVLVRLRVGTQVYTLHTLPASPQYVLNLTEYSGILYVAVGASSENKVYIYADPIGQLDNNPKDAVSPVQVLHVTDPDYVSFSANAQFIMAEHDTQFGVYDIQNKVGYNYTSTYGLDAPQANATWMDGDRLTYVSNGNIVVFDYDDTNAHTLVADSANYVPFFSPSYNNLLSVSQDSTGTTVHLNQTSMLTPADQ